MYSGVTLVSGVWRHSTAWSRGSGITPHSGVWSHHGDLSLVLLRCMEAGVGDLESLRSLEIGVTPQLGVWNLDSLLECTLVSLRVRETGVTPLCGAWDLESLHFWSLESPRRLESGVTPVYGVWSRVSGLQDLESGCLSPHRSLGSGVWNHSGI